MNLRTAFDKVRVVFDDRHLDRHLEQSVLHGLRGQLRTLTRLAYARGRTDVLAELAAGATLEDAAETTAQALRHVYAPARQETRPPRRRKTTAAMAAQPVVRR